MYRAISIRPAVVEYFEYLVKLVSKILEDIGQAAFAMPGTKEHLIPTFFIIARAYN